MNRITANRYHDISCGHRVVGHEGKCQNLHGHNYRIHFTIVAAESVNQLDSVGRVLDFGVIKELLCMWLEENWDHRFLIWTKDRDKEALQSIDPTVVFVPFNPTAENIGEYLVKVVGPKQLLGTSTVLTKVVVEETMKCSVTIEK
jgi:6-pyruvoyltetrahydropterin/6-carboxytetrahydropterin synthase